ncbi:MAG: hypothetical protein J0I06_23240 [Planctomycetes bacterium]|nr:hypothetical protein [Planctomycetota bacterium]
MRTILAVTVLAVCAAGLTGQDDKKYEKEGKFTAKFPSAPIQDTKSAGGLTLHIFLADYEKGKGGFLVIYSDLPADKLKAPTPDQVLDSGKKALEDDFKLKNVKAEPTAVGPKKYPGRTISGDREELNLRGQIVLVGNRLYQVYVFGPKDFVTGKEADDFLASFKITD